MQLKGLVRFFAILLIIYSLYTLSFTLFVKRHESKMASRALTMVKANHPDAKNFSDGDDLPDSLKKIYRDQLKSLLESSRDETLTYGVSGPVSYQQAKAEELNLGLDLQGGMNVTLEIEMTGLLRTLANNSKEPNFQAALASAEKSKKNSDADFVTLFANEYEKLAGPGKLAGLFFAANDKEIKIDDSDAKVRSVLRAKAKDAFNNNFLTIGKRIDKFGVAQPTISPDPNKGIITIELPGIQDRQRVRNQLQSSANLEFWETYPFNQDMAKNITGAIQSFDLLMKGQQATDTTKPVKVDTTSTGQVTPQPVDTAGNIDLGKFADTGVATQTPGTPTTTTDPTKTKQLTDYIGFTNGFSSSVGVVNIADTGLVMQYLKTESIRRNFPADAKFVYGIPDKSLKNQLLLYALKTYNRDKAVIEGKSVVESSQDYDPNTSRPIVRMRMDAAGAREWARITDVSHKNQVPIAIVMDDQVYSAPIASEKIEGGESNISGSFTVQEAQDLADLLNSGKLSAPAKIVAEQQVGPTLGAEAINGGMMAFFVSFIVIFILMLVYYNTAGWIANIALILNLLFTVGVLTGLGATLTAPGIAGLVLTIGMAVDTNVIIYERIKEELDRGKGYIPAINDGYRRSLPPVLDGHITILLTAVILYSFGLGPVKGFATTQILGILLSLFCGILVSRWISDIFTNKKRHLKYFTGISRRVFKHAKFKFIEYRKVAYTISFFVLALGIASFFNGFDYGVEFSGGRSYTVRFDKEVANVEQVRDDLKAAFENENPVIKTIGDAQTLDITTSYKIDEPDQILYDSIVEHTLMTGLKTHLPANITYEQFDSKYKLGSKKVLPTISDDLKKGAVQATLFAILAIFLYIFIRFRDWRYSLGTIIALLHDVLITLIVFSFCRSIVPFPLEIDQHFIAAVLTVIGFSMNDTVIVFDRIREDKKLYPSAPLRDTINRAINETLSRTIMTSLTVFLTILVLFILGGEVTRGFAFAMLIGVLTGTYSSIFVAAPVLVDLGGKQNNKPAKTTEEKIVPASKA